MNKLRGNKYYQLAEAGSLDKNHPGMKLLLKLSKKSKRILDLGCGEGTRLNWLVTKGSQGLGIDISKKAIDLARKKYPRLKFEKADLEKLLLDDESYDLIYMAFVLEHLRDPEKVLIEAIRVLKKGGNLVLVAPNYGSPNRASPPFKGSRIEKLVRGFFNDIRRFLVGNYKLRWNKVNPIDVKDGDFQSDFDTEVEPYLGSLIKFIESKDLKVIKYSSCWEQEMDKPKYIQKIFRFLGQPGIYPFSLWGPHLLLHAVKRV